MSATTFAKPLITAQATKPLVEGPTPFPNLDHLLPGIGGAISLSRFKILLLEEIWHLSSTVRFDAIELERDII